MFGCATRNAASARVSGSERGYSPAPDCSQCGPQSAGKLRLASSPSSGGASLTVPPSQFWIVPSGKQEVVVAAGLVRTALDHDPRIVLRRLPRSGRILEPHRGDHAVAVDVLLDQTVLLLRFRERADRRADVARLPGEDPLHAVDIDRRDQVGRGLGQQSPDRLRRSSALVRMWLSSQRTVATPVTSPAWILASTK